MTMSTLHGLLLFGPILLNLLGGLVDMGYHRYPLRLFVIPGSDRLKMICHSIATVMILVALVREGFTGGGLATVLWLAYLWLLSVVSGISRVQRWLRQ